MRRPKNTLNRNQVEINQPDQMKYWSKHFGVTPEELLRLVEKVGNSASAIRKELNTEGQGRPERQS